MATSAGLKVLESRETGGLACSPGAGSYIHTAPAGGFYCCQFNVACTERRRCCASGQRPSVRCTTAGFNRRMGLLYSEATRKLSTRQQIMA